MSCVAELNPKNTAEIAMKVKLGIDQISPPCTLGSVNAIIQIAMVTRIGDTNNQLRRLPIFCVKYGSGNLSIKGAQMNLKAYAKAAHENMVMVLR